jgi:hypothetical protein
MAGTKLAKNTPGSHSVEELNLTTNVKSHSLHRIVRRLTWIAGTCGPHRVLSVCSSIRVGGTVLRNSQQSIAHRSTPAIIQAPVAVGEPANELPMPPPKMGVLSTSPSQNIFCRSASDKPSIRELLWLSVQPRSMIPCSRLRWRGARVTRSK